MRSNEERVVTSIKDTVVAQARELSGAKGRIASGQFLAEGEEAIRWLMDSPAKLIHVFIHDKLMSHPFTEQLKKLKIPLFYASDGILKKITNTAYLVPFVGVAEEIVDSKSASELLILFDGVQDFGNIGTIVRTAEAFGIKEFASTSPSFDWYYKKSVDASRGMVYRSNLTRFAGGPAAVEALKDKGYQVAVTTIRDSIVQGFAEVSDKPLVIVFGNETEGVSKEVEEAADLRIRIPMSGEVESLNVGVAAGISIYELKIKWIMAMMTKKIQESLGSDLFVASRWLRLAFDKKLQEATPFSADQAIALMVLHCDRISSVEKLTADVGGKELHLKHLMEQGYIRQEGESLHMTAKGEEAIAKIWLIHEFVENTALKGLSEEERNIFTKGLRLIHQNCETIVPFS